MLPYADRRAALITYVTSLSKSCKPHAADQQTTQPATGYYELAGLRRKDGKYDTPTPSFKRLHALYLIHNVLLALQDCKPTDLPYAYEQVQMNDILNDLKEHTIRLFQLAACRGEFATDNVTPQLTSLLQFWRDRNVFEQSQLDTLKAVTANAKDRPFKAVLQQLAAEDDQKIIDARKAHEEATKWFIPNRHGVKDDPKAPWWELPAANGLYMRRIHGYPLKAAAFLPDGYPLKNAGMNSSISINFKCRIVDFRL